MRKFDNIIMSDTAPSIYSIWLKNGKLYYFNNGTWVEIPIGAVALTLTLSEPIKANE